MTAFGVPEATGGGPFENPFLFTGREWDAELGVYYYRARYYDPASGRFLQPDLVWSPLRPATLNRYVYVNNNPVLLTDPTGRQSGQPGASGDRVRGIPPGVPPATFVRLQVTDARDAIRRLPSGFLRTGSNAVVLAQILTLVVPLENFTEVGPPNLSQADSASIESNLLLLEQDLSRLLIETRQLAIERDTVFTRGIGDQVLAEIEDFVEALERGLADVRSCRVRF